MATLVKPWNDGSGDTFAVIYNHETQEATFSSMPNYGAEREQFVRFQCIDDKDAFFISVRQGDTFTESKGRPVRGSKDGIDIRAEVYLNQEGDTYVVNLIVVEDE